MPIQIRLPILLEIQVDPDPVPSLTHDGNRKNDDFYSQQRQVS